MGSHVEKPTGGRGLEFWELSKLWCYIAARSKLFLVLHTLFCQF